MNLSADGRERYLNGTEEYRRAFEDGMFACLVVIDERPYWEDIVSLIEFRRSGVLSAEQFLCDLETFCSAGVAARQKSAAEP